MEGFISKFRPTDIKPRLKQLFRYLVSRPTVSAFISVLFLASVVMAGSLTPPGAPGSTFRTVGQIYASIASNSFDSSSFTASTSGSLINHLLYIEQNLGWASTSPDIYTLNSGNVGIGDETPETKFEVVGAASVSALFVDGQIVEALWTRPSSSTYLLNSGDNVGIGTSAPGAKFEVRGGGVGLESLVFASSSASILSPMVGFEGFTVLSGGLGTGYADSSTLVPTMRLTNDGNLVNIGAIQAGEMLLTGAGTFAARVDYPTGPNNFDVQAADLDGDGYPDIVVVDNSDDEVNVLINDGDGTFAAKVDYAVGSGPYSIALGDVDGDGYVDIVSSNRTDDDVSVLINDGDGTFAAKVDYAVEDQPHQLALGDVNGDGTLDIATANGSANSVSILLNNGDGTFGTNVDYTTGSYPISVALPDVDGDGKKDITTANFGTTTASVLLNNGDGTFAAKIDYSAGGSPYDIVAADFNGDGAKDIAIPNFIPDTVSVLINDGDGTFAAPVAYTVDDTPDTVAVGDVNGDGLADIVAASFNTGTASVLINDGDGTFAAKVDYSTGGSSKGNALADVDGDGKIDLITLDSTADEVSVHLNQVSTLLYAQASSGYIGIGTSNPSTALDVSGSASVSGNFELSGTVSSHLIPTIGDTYDLGSSANRWRDLYLASGSLHIGAVGDEAVLDYDDGFTVAMSAAGAGGQDIDFELDQSSAGLSSFLTFTNVNDSNLSATLLAGSSAPSLDFKTENAGNNWSTRVLLSGDDPRVFLSADDGTNTGSLNVSQLGVEITPWLNITGNASISGNFELSGTVSSHLIPTIGDTYDLGSSANRWRDLYLASGSLHVGVSGDEAIIDYNVNDDYLSFKPDGSTTGFVMTDGGNMGIGTTSPITQLHIPGSVPTSATGSVATGTTPYSVYVQGNYAYVSNYTSSTLQVIDVSDPTSPVGVGSVATGTNPYAVYVQGRYAYVVNVTGSGLGVFDVSDPTAPVSVGTVATGDTPSDVYVQGRYAYMIDQGVSDNLRIIDVSDPTAPVSVSTVATGANPVSIYVQSRYAYIVNQSGTTLQVIDVSDPTSPVSVGSVATGTNPSGIYVQGRYAYVTNQSDNTLQVFDVSDPSSPVSVGTGTTGTTPIGVYVQGRYAYVTNTTSRTLQVFDVSDPTAPVSVGTVATGTSPFGLFVQGRYAYVTNYTSNTLQIFDVGGAYVQQLETGGIETGTLALRNNLEVGNDADIRGGLIVARGLQVQSFSAFASDAWFGGHASVSGNLEVDGVLYADGGCVGCGGGVTSNSLDFDEFVNSMTLDANLTVASGSGPYTVNWEPFFVSDLVPNVDDTYSLGRSALRWSELFVASGSLHIGADGDDSSITYETSSGSVDFMAFQPDGVITQFRIFEGGNASISGNFEVGGTLIASTINLSSISGNLEIAGFASASQYFSGGLTDCDDTNDKLIWTASGSNAGTFSCGTDQGAGANGWTDDGAVVRLNDVTDNVGIGTTTGIAKLTVRGDAGNNQIVSIASSNGAELFAVEKDGDIFLNIGHLGNVGFGMATGVVPDGQVTFRGDDSTNDGEKLFNIEFSNGADKFTVFEGGASVSIDLEITGTVKIADGADTAPSLVFANDPDTGIYLGDFADEFAIGTGGVERLLVDGSGDVIIGNTTLLGGNLGIGDSSPDARLDIVGKAGELIVTIASSNGDSVFSILANGDVILTDDDGVSNQFGNVGIGDPTPDAQLGINTFNVGDADEAAFSIDLNNSDKFILYFGGQASATADWEWSSGAQIIGPDGSRTDPPFTFSSDRGAGFYYQAARNAFAWVNDGNEMLYADEDSFCFNIQVGNLDCDFSGDPMLYVEGNGSNDIAAFASANNTIYFRINETGTFDAGGNGITPTNNDDYNSIGSFGNVTGFGTTFINSGDDLRIDGNVELYTGSFIIDSNGGGTISNARGTAALPAYSFNSGTEATMDPDTGMWSAGANLINFSTGGVERMEINADGNVGINDSTPVSTLDILASGSQSVFRVASGSTNELMEIFGNGDVLIHGIATPVGNVGIGTSDTTQSFLTIQGVTNNTHTASLLTEDSNGTDTFIVFDDGNASLSGSFEVSGAYVKIPNGSAGAPSLQFQGDPDMGLYRSGTDILGFSTAGTERVIIDASGDTAISTGVLQVSGTSFVAYNRLGTNTTGQGLNANEDLLITDALEVDGMIYADGGLTMGGSITLGGNSITGGGSFGGTSISVSGGGGFGASVSANEFLASDGGASDASFTFTSDETTGMFKGFGGVAFTVSGTEKGHFDSAGLDVSGVIDAVGGFSDAGTAGIDIACAGTDALNGISVSGGIVTAGSCSVNGSDYAENFYSADSGLEPGDLVVASPDGMLDLGESADHHFDFQGVERSTSPYQGTVVGIYSTKPGKLIGPTGTEEHPVVPVALAGRVPVKITGDIEVGDKLTSSERPGIAMKATQPGMVVGMALTEPYASGSHQYVMAFVNPQFWAPSIDLGEGTVLEDLGVSDSFLSTLFDVIVAMFRDILGISFEEGKISSEKAEFSEVKTETLCLDDVCVTKDELRELLEAGDVEPAEEASSESDSSGSGSGGTVEEEGEDAAEDVEAPDEGEEDESGESDSDELESSVDEDSTGDDAEDDDSSEETQEESVDEPDEDPEEADSPEEQSDEPVGE